MARRPPHTEEEMAVRIAKYDRVYSYLSPLSNDVFMQLLSEGKLINSGVGGEVYFMKVNEVQVVIKKIRLTAIEEKNPLVHQKCI